MQKLLAKHWLLLVPISLLFILYFPVINTYFSHDDFFHFNIGRTDGSLSGFLDLFAVRPRGYGFYRQLGREALFYLYYSVFGLDHLPFRIGALVLQIINLTFVYTFIYQLFKNKKHALFTSSFFALSTANVGVLYYLAGGIQMQLVVFFAFISLFSFRQYILKRNIWLRVVSLISFIGAIQCHELGFVIPFLLAIQIWFMWNGNWKDLLVYIASELLMFWYALFIYIYIDIVVIGHPTDQAAYIADFGIKKLANTLMWYTGWALGLPQMLVDFITSGFGIDPRLMQYWGNYYLIIFPFFFLSLILFAVLKTKLFIKSREIILNKYLIGFLLWFVLSIAPMLILPTHKQAHYLSLSLVGFWGALGYLLFVWDKKSKITILKKLFIICLVIFNLGAIQLSKVTYPAVQRGRIAKVLIDDIKKQYPILPHGAALLVKNDPEYPFIADEWGGSAKQASHVLSNENAFQVLYNDTNLKVYYEGESYKENIPDNAYEFVAKIPL